MLDKFFEFLKHNHSAIAAYFGVITGICSILYTWFKDRKNRFSIKAYCSDSHFFPALDTTGGNQYSLTLYMKITNKSAAPLNVSDILLKRKFPDHCIKDTVDSYIEVRESEGDRRIEFNKGMITLPKYLEPYGELEGRVLFVYAGVPKPCNINVINLEIVTSRGTKTIKAKCPSYEFEQTFFEGIIE